MSYMIKPGHDKTACRKILRPVRDALDMLNGKWKLPIIIALMFGEKRFTEISKEVEGITDRMLSRELRDLELNGLIQRKVEDSYPVRVTYSLTPYSKSLNEVIESLRKWGTRHRMKLKTEYSQPK
ncbi:winged helix-turn-helix transcriptional regulator [Flavitalea antarctica]